MRRYLNYFYSVMAGILFLPACNESEIEYNKGEEPLVLTVNSNNLTLDIRLPKKEVLTFSWTAGSNSGTNSAIDYTLQIDKQGNNFSHAVTIDIGRRIYSWKYTHEQLNRLLLEEFGINPGASGNLEARIVAVIADEKVNDLFSEVLAFTVKSYKPISSTLYLIGDATPNGWSADDATPMNSISSEPGGFIWTGTLSTGEMKFITTLGQFLPSYNKGNDDNSLVFRDNNDQPDDKFRIASAGNYKVKVNLIDLTITIEAAQGPRYNMIYFVGSFTGWSFEPMVQDVTNPFVFKYGREMPWTGGGEFKFGTQAGSWDNMLHPTIPKAPYTHSAVMQDGSGDNKWELTEEECNQAYKMALDITEGAEKFTMSPFTPYPMIYLVGSATPNGWDIGNATPMTATDGDPYTFTWIGTLAEGELKFSCDKQGDWSGAWFLAYENGLEPDSQEQQMVFSARGDGGNDRKWYIAVPGSYTIVLNQLTEVASITPNPLKGAYP
jgi:hypothetical protein